LGIFGRCTEISFFECLGLDFDLFYLLLLEIDFPCFTEVFFPESDLFVNDFALVFVLILEFLLLVSKLLFKFPLFSILPFLSLLLLLLLLPLFFFFE
jgi:hypothetical protein